MRTIEPIYKAPIFSLQGGSFQVPPRRGLSYREAARYVGVATSLFLALVEKGKMPKPLQFERRTVWDMRALDAAFEALVEEQEAKMHDEEKNGWEDVDL